MRVRYVAQLGRLLSGTACGLLVTLDYPQAERAADIVLGLVHAIEIMTFNPFDWQLSAVGLADWYRYLMRRLAERPANVLFLARNLLRG